MAEEPSNADNSKDFAGRLEGFVTNAYNACGDKLRTQLAGTIQMTLKDKGKKYFFDGRTGKFLETASTTDCQIELNSRHLEDISQGDLNPQIAMLTEKISVSGDVSLAVYFFNLVGPDQNN